MKVSIELTEAEVKGIKDYLKELDGIEKPTKGDIQRAMQGEISALLQAPHSALFDHIQKYL